MYIVLFTFLHLMFRQCCGAGAALFVYRISLKITARNSVTCFTYTVYTLYTVHRWVYAFWWYSYILYVKNLNICKNIFIYLLYLVDLLYVTVKICTFFNNYPLIKYFSSLKLLFYNFFFQRDILTRGESAVR